MRIFVGRVFTGIAVLGVLWLSAVVVGGGLRFEVAGRLIQTEKVIIPGMITWFALALGALLVGNRSPSPVQVGADCTATVALGPPLLWPGRTFGVACLAALGLAALASVRGHMRQVGFDDDDFLIPQTAQALGWTDLPWALWSSGWGGWGYFRPVPELLWFLEARAHGCDYHATFWANIGIHALGAASWGLLAHRLVGSPFAAASTTLLFAVYGTHAEPLQLVSSRYDLMATLFSGACLWAHRARLDGLVGSWLSPTALLLALLSKESAYSLPLAVVLISLPPAGDRSLRERLGATVPHWLVLITLLVARLALRGSVGGYYSGAPEVRFDKLALLPLSPLPPLTWPLNIEAIVDLAVPARIAIALTLALLPFLAWRSVSRAQGAPCPGTLGPAAIAYGVMVLVTAPAYNVISLPRNLDQSRYVYMPAAAACLWISALTHRLPGRWPHLTIAALVACHFALLRVNTESYVTAAVTMTRAVEQSGSVSQALAAGKVVRLEGMPEVWRGANLFRDDALARALGLRSRDEIGRLQVDCPDRTENYPRADVYFQWHPLRGFTRVEPAPPAP